MSFPIDVSKPFRYPSELERLVKAVIDAGEYDETRWIEWKSQLDLTSPEATRHIVRQILGFANRNPQVAATWAEGHAYLLVGVSPGDLRGITPLDPEQLVSKVRPYVGSDVQWSPEYVKVNGATVLVVIVLPPCAGDPIHPLRKHLDHYKLGTILIRRHGQTEQADVDEIRMLERRLLSGATQVDVTVEPIQPELEAYPDFDALTDKWIERERAKLEIKEKHEGEPEVRLGLGFHPVRPVDRRSSDQYMQQVSTYMVKAKQALVERGIWEFARHSPAMLKLRLVNRSERNFTKVRAVVSFDSSVAEIYKYQLFRLIEGERPELVEPPIRFGELPPDSTRPLASAFPPKGGRLRSLVNHDFSYLIGDGIPRWRRGWQAWESEGSVHIQFDPKDLRPYATLTFRSVPIKVFAQPGKTISAQWEATATNADGRGTGTFAINVLEPTLGEGWME